jgi:hypothetical protein
MIFPTIGRVVWVHNRAGQLSVSQPEAALVTWVHDERCVNVGGFDQLGRPFGEAYIQLLQDDDKAPLGVYAEWMPYQKKQAAKYPEKDPFKT